MLRTSKNRFNACRHECIPEGRTEQGEFGAWRHTAEVGRCQLPGEEVLGARRGVTFVDDHFALIVRMTRRYEVNDGVPLSSTARMMCAVPATRGVTITRGLVAS